MSANEEIELVNKLKEAARVLKESEALLVCAGAGMGVDSGLPDFRGNEGFWKAYPPFAKLGYSFIDMANPGWFDREPDLAWGFYGHRLNLYRSTIPHEGFKILLELGQAMPGEVFVFTSNVDGQFQKAGFSEDEVIECHGSIHHLQCSRPCNSNIWEAAQVNVNVDESTMRVIPPLPTCPNCGGVARPNILMFGDWGWHHSRSEDQQERFSQWLDENRSSKITVVELGAGTAVPTVRLTAERIAVSYRGRLIRINVREPQCPKGHIGLPLGALEAMRAIRRLL